MIEKYEFDSGRAGINLLILAGVHGNETAGTYALKRLLQKMNEGVITLQKGKLTFVPICNPEAHKQDVRQIDENLNRVMKMHKAPTTYEQKLANEICPLIEKCDVLLDLHSTHCEGDVPFAFCDYPNAINSQLIDCLDVDYVLEGWPEIYAGQGEIEDNSTEHCAHMYGRTGTTLECGYHKSVAATELAYSAIMSTLACMKLIDSEMPAKRSKTHILMKNYVVKKRAGQLCKNYKHLDIVRKGEEIARYADGEVLTAVDDGYILLPNLQAEIGAEWYYFGTKKL